VALLGQRLQAVHGLAAHRVFQTPPGFLPGAAASPGRAAGGVQLEYLLQAALVFGGTVLRLQVVP